MDRGGLDSNISAFLRIRLSLAEYKREVLNIFFSRRCFLIHALPPDAFGAFRSGLRAPTEVFSPF